MAYTPNDKTKGQIIALLSGAVILICGVVYFLIIKGL